MSRGAGLCGLCGGPKRGRAARLASPIADCVDCGEPVCGRHSVQAPDQGGYRCRRCDRKRKKSAPRPEPESASPI